MHDIPKHIVTDEEMHPIAVQIAYSDWLKIQQWLNLSERPDMETDLARHAGKLNWPVDGLRYQEQIRAS